MNKWIARIGWIVLYAGIAWELLSIITTGNYDALFVELLSLALERHRSRKRGHRN